MSSQSHTHSYIIKVTYMPVLNIPAQWINFFVANVDELPKLGKCLCDYSFFANDIGRCLLGRIKNV